jgi:hypothetical protein
MVLTSGAVRWVVFLALAGFLGWLLIRVLALFLRAMTAREGDSRPGFWIETNWGGLGGGMSGWRVSNAIVYLLVMSLLLGCLALVVVSLPPDKAAEATAAKTEEKKGDSPVGTAAKTAEAKTAEASDGSKKGDTPASEPKKPSDAPDAGKNADQKNANQKKADQ